MTYFISGMLVAGYSVAGLFFLRFWRQSSDRLFLFFAAAFGLLAVQRGVLSIMWGREDIAWVYALRLTAFVLILYAIVDKNRPRAD